MRPKFAARFLRWNLINNNTRTTLIEMQKKCIGIFDSDTVSSQDAGLCIWHNPVPCLNQPHEPISPQCTQRSHPSTFQTDATPHDLQIFPPNFFFRDSHCPCSTAAPWLSKTPIASTGWPNSSSMPNIAYRCSTSVAR